MIVFNDVSKKFKNGTVAISDIDLKIMDGEFCYIVGPSGAGKSTLIKLLIKEYRPSQGTIVVDGLTLNHMPRYRVALYRRNIGFVFQNFRLLADRSAFENVSFAAECIGLSPKEVKHRTAEVLDFVGLMPRRNHRPHELSAGEQQRVAIARALVNRPRFIIADEPTGNLDHETAVEIMHLMEAVHATGATMIMATHSQPIIDAFPHRIITLSGGRLTSDTGGGLLI